MSQLKIGLIGGSGLGAAMAEQTSGTRHEIDTPFGRPSDAIVETAWDGLPVLFLSRHGPGHLLHPSQINFRANLFALKMLGCTHILASGAVGSLREEYKPRDLVIVDQVIDKTYRRIGTFFDNAAVHVEMAEPFCPVLRQILHETSNHESIATAGHGVHPRGTYVCMEGPAFSTRAESLMHRLWGGDLIGMTAMPEAKLAKEAEIPYALIALVTDYDCWRPHADAQGHALDPFKLLNEIIGHLKDATENAIRLMKKTVAAIAADPSRLSACPATRALQLAIWSDKARIAPAERQRLAPIWMKYFEQS
jgi:5'-methylthioadenosine phosphorylase